MLVPVIPMGGVEMAVVEIVDMVAVEYSHVAAVWPVHVNVLGVHNAVIH